MSKKIFVGNLPWSVDDNVLADLFNEHGEVISARVITDRETGRSRGFGFVEMKDGGAAKEAMRALDGAEVDGRALRVNEANERESRPPRRPR